jgi:hypothetical protein
LAPFADVEPYGLRSQMSTLESLAREGNDGRSETPRHARKVGGPEYSRRKVRGGLLETADLSDNPLRGVARRD